MVVLIALLYSAFFWIQSTNFSWLETLLLNLSCSTAWGISLELLNWIVWSRLAAALNRFENHKTSNSHENHLIAKIFIFFFIDCFLWFFILAFFQIPFGSQVLCPGSCLFLAASRIFHESLALLENSWQPGLAPQAHICCPFSRQLPLLLRVALSRLLILSPIGGWQISHVIKSCHGRAD